LILLIHVTGIMQLKKNLSGPDIIIIIQPLGQFWQEPEPSQANGMSLARCILGKYLVGSLPLLSPGPDILPSKIINHPCLLLLLHMLNTYFIQKHTSLQKAGDRS
jgi:hypothetical protein